MVRRIIITIVVLLITKISFSQDIDTSLVNKHQDYYAMADSCLKIASKSFDVDTVRIFAEKAYQLSLEINDKQLTCKALNNLSWAYFTKNNFDSAEIRYKQLLLLAIDINDQQTTALTYCNLGLCYRNTENYFEMWNSFRQASDIYTAIGDTAHLCWTQRSMGTPYEKLGLFDNAINLYNEALKLALRKKDSLEIGNSLFKIGNCTLMRYIDSISTNFIDTMILAKEYLRKAELMLHGKELLSGTYPDNILSLSRSYIKLAYLTNNNAFADSSAFWLKEYNKKYFDPKDQDNVLESKLLQSELDIYHKHYKESIQKLENLLNLFPKEKYLARQAEICRQLTICYTATNNLKKAYENSVKNYELIQKIHNDESIKRVSSFAAQTNIDRIRRQKELFTKSRNEFLEKERKRHRNYYIALAFAFFFVIAATTLTFVSLYRKRKLNNLLKNSNDKLTALRTELDNQRIEEETARSIMISNIEYASDIQTATIGNVEMIKNLFPESFVYYLPRDIVSGDWYYATTIDKYKMIVIADCTGHGIPGAMLSMLGVGALKDIIHKIEDSKLPIKPGEILDNMRIAIKKALNKSIEANRANVDDGMDMTILIFPPDSSTMLFGGANQCALLVHNNEVNRLKGDPNPIGNFLREREHFTTIETEITQGDAVYIFSDGIQDQVGGSDIRKFSLKRITQFVEDNHNLPMLQQLQNLKNTIDTWTNDIPQVDDRSMIGIRI